MSPARKRTLGILSWLALVGLSLRPVGAVDAGLDVALSPLRVVAELASPLWVLRGPEVRAAQRRLLASWPAEARAGEEILARLALQATPSDPALRAGRRLVHAEVIGRPPRNRDQIRIRLRDARGVESGMPVVCGDAFVGRVLAVDPGADPAEGGDALAELVTAKTFHVGARVVDEETGLVVDMTVGGLDDRTAGSRRVALAVRNPSERALDAGVARVHERLAEVDRFAALSAGYRLGSLRRVGTDDRWVVVPELDFLDGLFHVVVLGPAVPELPSNEPMPQALADTGWVRARALSHGDPAVWRESLKLAAGSTDGVAPGYAVALGARLVGRVTRASLWSSDASLLGDAGMTVVAVARFDGDERAFVLGRLVSLGRDAGGTVRFRWNGVVPPIDGAGDGTDAGGGRRARLFTGSGDPGMPSGLYLGEALVPVGTPESGAPPRQIRLLDAPSAARLRALWVRVEERGTLRPREGGA